MVVFDKIIKIIVIFSTCVSKIIQQILFQILIYIFITYVHQDIKEN